MNDFNTYRRISPFYILYQFLKTCQDLLLLIAAMLLARFTGIIEHSVDALFFVPFGVYLILKFLTSIYRWYAMQFRLLEDRVQIKKGLLSVRTISIPFSSIVQINTSQPLLYRLFRQSILKLDTTATGDDFQYVFEALPHGATKSFRSIVEDREEHVELESCFGQIVYRGDTRLIIFHALSSLQTLSIATSMAFFIYVNTQTYFADFSDMVGTVLTTWWGVALLLLFSVAASYITQALKYWNFTVSDRSSSLFVSSGLIRRNMHEINRGDISLVRISTSLVRQLFSLSRVEALAISEIGKSDDEKDKHLLSPFIKEQKVNDLLEVLNFDFQLPEQFVKSRNAYCFFWLGCSIILCLAVITPIVQYYLDVTYHAAPIIVFLCLLVFSQKAFTGHSATDNQLWLKKGLLYQTIYGLKRHKIEEFSSSQSRIQKILGIHTVYISFRFAPIKKIVLRYVADSDLQRLQSWILSEAEPNPIS